MQFVVENSLLIVQDVIGKVIMALMILLMFGKMSFELLSSASISGLHLSCCMDSVHSASLICMPQVSHVIVTESIKVSELGGQATVWSKRWCLENICSASRFISDSTDISVLLLS